MIVDFDRAVSQFTSHIVLEEAWLLRNLEAEEGIEYYHTSLIFHAVVMIRRASDGAASSM